MPRAAPRREGGDDWGGGGAPALHTPLARSPAGGRQLFGAGRETCRGLLLLGAVPSSPCRVGGGVPRRRGARLLPRERRWRVEEGPTCVLVLLFFSARFEGDGRSGRFLEERDQNSKTKSNALDSYGACYGYRRLHRRRKAPPAVMPSFEGGGGRHTLRMSYERREKDRGGRGGDNRGGGVAVASSTRSCGRSHHSRIRCRRHHCCSGCGHRQGCRPCVVHHHCRFRRFHRLCRRFCGCRRRDQRYRCTTTAASGCCCGLRRCSDCALCRFMRPQRGDIGLVGRRERRLPWQQF